MSMLENMQNVSINRRSLVAGAAGLGLAGVLAGCSNEGDGSGAGSASGSASGSAFMIGWALTLSHFHRNNIQSSILIGFLLCAQLLPYFFEPDALILFSFVYGLAGLIDPTRE